jgi:hypothetical protein
MAYLIPKTPRCKSVRRIIGEPSKVEYVLAVHEEKDLHLGHFEGVGWSIRYEIHWQIALEMKYEGLYVVRAIQRRIRD